MTPAEFTRWLDYHKNAYPAIGAWLMREDNSRASQMWERALEPVPYYVAVCATDAMLVDENPPTGYSDHCRYIRSYHARQQPAHGALNCWGPTVKDDRLVAHCSRCMDYGIVSVLTPTTLANAYLRKVAFSVQSCAIACDCDRGHQIVANREKVKAPLLQFTEGHAVMRMDDVITRMVEYMEQKRYSDVGEALRNAVSDLVHEYHAQRKGHEPLPEFAAYAPKEDAAEVEEVPF